MKTNNFVELIKSPAVTIFVATICVAFLMSKVPDFIQNVRSLKDSTAD